MKAESQWPAEEDRRVALAMSGSTRFRRMPTLYCYLRCRESEIARDHGAAQRSLGLRDDDDGDDDMTCVKSGG